MIFSKEQHENIQKLHDSVKSSKARDAKKVSELNEGDEITYENEKWTVSQIRKGPFGLTLRLNSKSSPTKTREVTYKSTDVVDAKGKDADPINDRMYIRELQQAIEEIKSGNYKKAKFFVDDVSNLLKYKI